MRRARPVLEGLEERVVMSATASGLPVAAESSPAGGLFSSNFQKFVYTTPQGTHVLLQIVGRGSMQGTTVDSSGALHLLFSQTNSFTKIMSDVHGGTGQAALASGEAGTDLQERVADRLAELRMIQRLEELRTESGDHFDSESANRAYARVFMDFGIDVDCRRAGRTQEATPASARVRRRPLPARRRPRSRTAFSF